MTDCSSTHLVSNKAVSNGAVSFFLDDVVKSRVSRMTFGTRCIEEFNSSSPTHQLRSNLAEPHEVTGQLVLDAFDVLLPKVSNFEWAGS